MECGLAPPQHHLPASLLCYAERRKAKREGKGEAIAALSGDKGKEGWSQIKRQQECVLLFQYEYCILVKNNEKLARTVFHK
jgi:hypothetical protein